MPDERDDLLSLVDPRWDGARTERALAGLHRRRARRRAGVALAGAGVLFLGAALAANRLVIDAPDARQADASPGGSPAREVLLADGSRVVPDEGAEVVVAYVTERRIGVRLERGAAHFEVVPGLPRTFSVAVGEVTVTVVGTAFRVQRLEDGTARVDVEHGRVRVAWAGGQEELAAGEGGVFPSPMPSVPNGAVDEVPPVVEAVAVREEAPESEAVEPARPRRADGRGGTRREGASRPAWRELARASRYDEAYAAMAEVEEPARLVPDRVEDLMLAADVARLSGHPVAALPWLAAVERGHPTDPRAAVAAFTRGRILAELGRQREAARQLERVLEMEPDGSLSEDALARAALAHAAAGNQTRAERLVARYLARYPEGRWARRLRALVPEAPTP